MGCRDLRRLLGRSSSTSTQIAELLRSSEDVSGAGTRFPGLGSFPACARSFMGSESTASGGTGEEERPDYAVAQALVQQTIARLVAGKRTGLISGAVRCRHENREPTYHAFSTPQEKCQKPLGYSYRVRKHQFARLSSAMRATLQAYQTERRDGLPATQQAR